MCLFLLLLHGNDAGATGTRADEPARRGGSGPQTRYRLNHPAFEPDREPIEPINDGINEGIKAALLRLVRNHPGRGVPFFLASVKASRATVERAVRALVRAGRIEHLGSRKTGGYYATQTSTP